MKIYDMVIIGSGPAGLAAGIYAKRSELDCIVIEKNGFSGGQVINTYEVDNYPGVPGISGFDLATSFREHCDKLGVEFMDGTVVKLERENEIKKVFLEDGTEYRSRTVIIATGVENRKLDVPGEEELAGMGVSYCATCDGAFFKNKVTAVVGGGDVAVEDAIYLARMCKKVYVIHRRNEFRAAKSLVSQLEKLDNVSIVWDSIVEKIQGTDRVEGIQIKNVKTEAVQELQTDGVFVAVGTKPETEIYKELIQLDEYGYICAGEDGKTNIPGVFAAGDIRTKSLRQIITAAADGANAVHSAEYYINTDNA